MGRPKDQTTELLAGEEAAVDQPDGTVIVPGWYLELLLAERREWRAWALALERAGRWRR